MTELTEGSEERDTINNGGTEKNGDERGLRPN
jgi:hypothetical protein